MSASVQSRSAASSERRVDISRYRAADLDALIDFRAERHGVDSLRADRAYVEWLYTLHPDAVDRDVSLFVCRAGSRIVGTQGLLRVGLKVGIDTLPAAWAIDFAVRQEPLRGFDLGLRGVGASIARVARSEVSVRMAIDVTQDALVLSRHAGWTQVCTVPRWARALDTRALLRARGASRVLLASARAGEVALRAFDAHAARRVKRAQVQLVPTAGFDERADRVWAAASPNYPVVCQRDYRYLAWRFDRFTVPNRYARFWLQRAGRVAGYAVLRIEDYRGVRAGFLVDYFCEPVLTSCLVASCLNVFRDAGAVVAFCVHLNPSANRIFRPLGFFRRSTGWPLIVYTKRVSPAIHESIARPSNWFVTGGDSNVDYVHPAEAATEPSFS
jgi:hypothetical protein